MSDRFFDEPENDSHDYQDPHRDNGNWDARFDDMDSGDWEDHFATVEDPRDCQNREDE